MNEVEKMYRNVHVYPRIYGDITKETFENRVFNMGDMCNEAFTAEKQIELIKWLARKSHITIGLGLLWGQYDDSWWTVTSKNGGLGKDAYKFEEALANFVNCLWQDLTEEEKQQIKNILESEVRE